jgi:hypothetical protein
MRENYAGSEKPLATCINEKDPLWYRGHKTPPPIEEKIKWGSGGLQA